MVGDRLSLASKGDNLMGKAGQVVLGNTFSGMVDFYHTAMIATNAAPVYWGLFLNGARLGLPGGGVLSQGQVGTAQDAALKAAFVNVASEAGQQAAADTALAVGFVKLGYDFATFAYGYIVECH
jgi:hypothetical protein